MIAWIVAGSLLLMVLIAVGLVALVAKVHSYGEPGGLD